MSDGSRAPDPPELVLLTDGFPFDGSEAVIGSELDVTADRFHRVFVVPSRWGTSPAPLPANVSVVDLDWHRGWTSGDKRRALRSAATAAPLAASLRRPSNVPSYFRHARTYLDLLASNVLKAERLARWIREQRVADAIFYDYWFENSTLALALLKRAGVVRSAVSRAHRFDIFDSAWPIGKVPFREFKAQHLDAVFAVSNDGAEYLRARFGREREKVRLSHLGVPEVPGAVERASGPPVVVSCSTLSPRKRVDLIPDVLRSYGRPVHWVHFGDGPERARVEGLAASLPPDVTWELRGWVENAEVRRWYASHPVAAFLSVSTSEGVPISMMEAQSFGIPIVSLDVGGIADLVTEATGVLLSEDASTAAVAAALDQALDPERFDARRIRAEFGRSFEALKNYTAFADDLIAIWRTGAGSRHA